MGEETIWLSVWGEVEGYFQEPTQRWFICLKENQGTLFLKWIKKWTTENDNIWKLILSLAELAKSQERSDDSSVVNNYYFVVKRQGKRGGPFLKLHFYYRSIHTFWKKFLAPRIVRVVPTTASCSGFVLSCVILIRLGWKKILFIHVVLNWASNQHNIALLCESLLTIASYHSKICGYSSHEPTHFAASFNEMLVIGTYLCFAILISSGHNCS